MTPEVTHIWQGASGKLYEYTIVSLKTKFFDIPGNYIFTKQIKNQWVSIYIGETGSLEDRLGPDHEKWDCAIKTHGATHIHFHKSEDDKDIRMAEEQDLTDRHPNLC